jgi:hypothetical protein
LELRNIEEPPIARDLIQATVEIAAVKCFGTEDPSDVDEPYVVVSVVSVDPHQLGQSGGAVTMRTEIINGVTPGRVFLEGRAVTERPIPVTGSGLHILVSLYEHENGDPNKIRDSIAAVIEDAAKKGAQAIVDAASGGDPKLNGPVGDFFDFEVGGVKPFKLLTVGLADVVADILGDDFVDTKTFILNEGDLLSIEKGPNSKFRKGELPAQDQFNVPTPIQEPDSLLSGGGGSYKVYFRVRVLRIPKPVEPPAVVA